VWNATYRFEIGLLDIGFTMGAAFAAEVVDDEIDILITVIWNDRRGPFRTTHDKTPTRQRRNGNGELRAWQGSSFVPRAGCSEHPV
jgi:hypothetical protein